MKKKLLLLLVVAISFFVSVSADCRLLTSLSICSSFNGANSTDTFTSNAAVDKEAGKYVAAFTGGSCTDTICTNTSIQGTASGACLAAAVDFACRIATRPSFGASPLKTCAFSRIAFANVSTCTNVFSVCSVSSITVNGLASNKDDFCDAYGCTNSTSCNNHGTCLPPVVGGGAPYCDCFANYTGPSCRYLRKPCPGDGLCSLHGVCNAITGLCECDSRFQGDQCQYVPCPTANSLPCSGHGTCRTVGVCKCDAGFIGDDCGIPLDFGGMSKGQVAGAIIGGLLVSLGVVAALGYWLYVTDGLEGFRD